MSLSAKSCTLGEGNPKHVYTMDGEALKETLSEKDIGVYISLTEIEAGGAV